MADHRVPSDAPEHADLTVWRSAVGDIGIAAVTQSEESTAPSDPVFLFISTTQARSLITALSKALGEQA